MPDIPPEVPVSIFDPALPFERVVIIDAGVDTWHEHILITRKVLSHLPHVDKKAGKGVLRVSGGMNLEVPVVTIGLKIGSVELPEVSALVVDNGAYELLLGHSIFGEIFREKAHATAKGAADGTTGEAASSGDDASENEELKVELYPVEWPFDSRNFEQFLSRGRQLYNIALIALGRIKVSGIGLGSVDSIIGNDEGIPDRLRLKITTIEEGSVVIALKSGCKDALRYLSSAFEKGASAKLAQELAEAKDAEVRATISKETRDATALEMRLEKERLSAQHIHETYQQYRSEARDRLGFFNDLIREVSDPELAGQLRERKDFAILEMADQMMVPIVRHVPDSHSVLRSTFLALPPAPDSQPRTDE